MNRMLMLTLDLSLAPVLCWAAEPKAEEAKAIAEIRDLGGYVTVDEKSPDSPVIGVNFMKTGPGKSSLGDAGLVYLKGMAHLQSLILWGTDVTDAGLENLEGLTQLQSLDLSYTRVTAAGLERLQGLTQLQSLDLVSRGA